MTDVAALVLRLMIESKLDQPNHVYTWMEMKRALDLDLVRVGSCFVWRVPGIQNFTVEVWRLDPRCVAFVSPTSGYPLGRYQVTEMFPTIADIPPEQISRLPSKEVSSAAGSQNRRDDA